jgi:bifunctional ADP-heptose synthase (sugar kinase/adenylyltransferase)
LISLRPMRTHTPQSPRPIAASADRTAMLAALACAVCLLNFAEETSLELLRRLWPELLARGGCESGRRLGPG